MRLAPFLRWYEGRSPWIRLLVAGSLAIGIALLDLSTGPDLSVSVLYLLPVGLVSWAEGRRLAFGASIVCAGLWGLVNHLLPGLPLGSAMAAWNTAVRLLFFLIVASSLGALRDAYRREAVLARTDALTGVLNVRGFRDAAELLFARIRRTREPVVVMALRLDGLGVVNERLGHEQGDRLLGLVGSRLRRRFRRHDIVGRLGGVAFAAILPDARAEDAHRLLDSLVETLQERLENDDWPAVVSVGWVAFDAPPATLDDALRIAGHRLRQAKVDGEGLAVGGPVG